MDVHKRELLTVLLLSCAPGRPANGLVREYGHLLRVTDNAPSNGEHCGLIQPRSQLL